MDALSQKKLTEGKQHLADAEKSLKTSFFKRKPDYDSAASSYNSAATCFKVIKDLNQAIECYQKSAECYKTNNSLYSAAKQYEQVGYLANEAKNYALVLSSIETAVDLLLTTGTRDSAGIILEKTSNMLKLNDPEKALKLMRKAIHVADVEDKHYDMVTFFEQAISMALRINQPNQAIELIEESFEILDKIGTNEQITKYILTVVLIHLSRDDWVAARSFLDKMKAKYSGEFSRVEDLIEAFDEKDDERMKGIIKNYLSYAVDNEALKIANKIVKSDEWLKALHEAKNETPVKILPKQEILNIAPPPPAQFKKFEEAPKINDEQVRVEKKAELFSDLDEEEEMLKLAEQAKPDVKQSNQQHEDEDDEFDFK